MLQKKQRRRTTFASGAPENTNPYRNLGFGQLHHRQGQINRVDIIAGK